MQVKKILNCPRSIFFRCCGIRFGFVKESEKYIDSTDQKQNSDHKFLDVFECALYGICNFQEYFKKI